jgi:hypothetical protein
MVALDLCFILWCYWPWLLFSLRHSCSPLNFSVLSIFFLDYLLSSAVRLSLPTTGSLHASPTNLTLLMVFVSFACPIWQVQ